MKPPLLLCLFLFGLAARVGAVPLASAGWSVDIRAGRIVALTCRLTGERLALAPARDSLPAGLHRRGEDEMPVGAAQTTERRGPQFVEQTAAWKDRSGAIRARMRTRFAVEPRTGDLLITQEGQASQKGLYGISWGLGDLPDPVETLVPGNSGQRFGPDAPSGRRVFEYPIGWEAPFALLQGKRGGILIRAEDPDCRFKNLVVERSRRAVRLRFESRNLAPFEGKTRIVSSRWRLTAYRGGWTQGAALYRRWMQRRFALTPLARRQPAWARDVRFVVLMNMDLPTLRALAKRCLPAQTLLYLPGWRRDEYDRNYPDYTAAPAFEPFITEAHRLGFRVMVHVNYFGCDPKHPLYATFRRWQMRDPVSKELLWWDWPRADPPIKFAYINPASKEWRRLFVARMVEVCTRYRVDALHLDQTLCIFNDAAGPIDGMNCIEGNIALHRDLRQALPQVALSGEGLDEVTCLYEQFAQRHLWGLNHADGTWNDRTIAQSHAVSSAVLAPFTHLYGYLGMANPNTAGLYTAWQQGYEHFGTLPTYAWPDVEQLKKPSPAAAALLEQAAFFQKYRPTPDFDAPWLPGDLFVYRLTDGRRAFYRRAQGVAFGVRDRAGRETILARRLEGVGAATLPGSVPGWPAYDARRIFGLDPRRAYAWSPQPRDLRAPRLSALPPGILVARSGIHPEFARFRLERAPGPDQGEIARLWDFGGQAAGGVRLTGGAVHRFEDSAFEDPASGGAVRPESEGLFMHPPWKAAGAQQAGIQPAQGIGLTFAEFTLRLPDRAPILFESGVHLDPGAAGKSDGVTFRVLAESGGRSLKAEAHAAAAAPVPLALDLSAFRGQIVRLRLEADPGPAGSATFDWGRMDRPVVLCRDAAPAAVQTVEIAGFRLNGPALCESGAVETQALPDGARLRLPLPNTLILPSAPPAVVTLPCDLTGLPFTSRLLFSDGMERPTYSYLRGQIGPGTCGGEERLCLHLHPPSNGRALADYWLKLPPEPVRLEMGIGVRDGSKSEGVAFEIEVNGRRVFQKALRPGSGWVPVSIDLSPWQGQPVMLTFITDSQGEFNFDWAVWGAPRLIGQAGNPGREIGGR